MKKMFLQSLWDFVGIPFRLLLFDQKWLPRFGWTTLADERFNAVFPYIRGRLLDVGAGNNTLVNRYGNGIGVDIHDWGGGVIIIEHPYSLPFKDWSFNTISFVASLNHIPYRQAALEEAWRLTKPNGRLIITMINPILGNIGHFLWWYGEHKKRGGMKKGEVSGLRASDIIIMCEKYGFRLIRHSQFVYRLNNLFVFLRPAGPAGCSQTRGKNS